ncbi:uncharacterized protein LOC114828086 [Galendromus occidentalis]|uniref:Uncharacterized protein LOC114828086 n=1 Tax=Galendromus occidentalis TaxID=34638 RepID=A0AAJ7SDG3_9ACAR|nr:uncharacterized protein LOC114828086 [Galendromus occidentalis]
MKFDGDPIRYELDLYLDCLYSTIVFLVGLADIYIFSRRRSLAKALNHLHCIWTCSGASGSGVASLSLIGGLVSLVFFVWLQCSLVLREVVHKNTSPSAFEIMKSSLVGWLIYMGFLTPVLLLSLMVFIYGSLTNALKHFLEKTDYAERDTEEKSAVILRDVLELTNELSSYISPISATCFGALLALAMQHVFLLMNPMTRASVNPRFVASYWLCVISGLIISLKLIDVLSKQISEWRLALEDRAGAIKDSLPLLKRIKHPPTVIGLFELRLGILPSIAAFAFSYFMTVLQLKTIIVTSTIQKPTNSCTSRTT